VGLIILGIVLFFGGGPSHDRLGFRYWVQPGAFAEFMAPGATGRFLAFWYAFARSGFSFILSSELIVVAAGEAQAPRRNIPKAASRFIYRLIAFYILGSLVIGVIVAYNDPELLSAVSSGNNTASASPFVLGIQRAGIRGLNHVINAVILTSAWSAGNAFLFAGSRSLYSLAITGQAPRIFKHCNKNGVPYPAVLLTFALGCLAYLNVSSGAATVFTWFSNIATISGYIAWIVVFYCYLRFHKASEFHGIRDILPYKAVFQPYATYIALFVTTLLTLTNGFYVFWPKKFTAASFLAAYITIPIFLVLWLGHKIVMRTRWAIPVGEMDVYSGKEVGDRLEELDVIPIPRNWVEKIWFWIA